MATKNKQNNSDKSVGKIPTSFTKMMGCDLPIIGAPMFLVSNEEIVTAVSDAGGVGAIPSLNYRPPEVFREKIKKIKAMTSGPVGVNIIVNKGNARRHEDLKSSLDAGVDLFITSLGNPSEVIREAHKNGAKVLCDVTNLKHALKVQDQGADGVIAVSSGAGGHAGPLSPLVLLPWLKKSLNIPVVAAGGIADGRTMAAALALGASAVSVGTRFIASIEATVDAAYKNAIVESSPEDIVMTSRISGTPVAVINTDYVKKLGKSLPLPVQWLHDHPKTKKYMVPLIHYMGMKGLEDSVKKDAKKQVWSAGQTVGLIEDIISCREIMKTFYQEYIETIESLPTTPSNINGSL